LIKKTAVAELIEAALNTPGYQPKRPKVFHKLRKRRRQIELPEQKDFTIPEFMRLFECSRTTVMRAHEEGEIKIERHIRSRWRIRRRSIVYSPLFGRFVRRRKPTQIRLAVRLPARELFTTADAGRYLGVSQQTVRNLIRAGLLTGLRLGSRNYKVTRESLRCALKGRS
jgi:excisionase family DNA binding protein